MKFSTQALADGLVTEVREYVRREVGDLRAGTASASVVAGLIERIEQLERRIAALEIKEKAAHVVRLAR